VQRADSKHPAPGGDGDDDDPSFGVETLRHIWRRHLVIHLEWNQPLATLIIDYGISFSNVCTFDVRIERGRILDHSRTAHAEHPYFVQGAERAYGVDDWTNRRGGIVERIQAGFRRLYLSRQMKPDLEDVMASFQRQATGVWTDTLLSRYVLSDGHGGRWYERTQFQLTLKFPVGAAMTVEEQFAVHLIYLRVSGHYRAKTMKVFGDESNFSALLRQMSTFIFAPDALQSVLTSAAEASGGTTPRALGNILEAVTKERDASSGLFHRLLELPSEGGESRILWNLIAAHLLGTGITERGGFLGGDDKATMNHLRFRLYSEWRAVYELLMVHLGLRRRYARGVIDGRLIVNIAHDGHCLFRAVANRLGNEDAHVRLRLGVAADEAADLPLARLAGAGSDRRIADMGNLDENIVWGGDAELMFLSIRVRRRIVVHRAGNLAPLIFDGFASIGGRAVIDAGGPDIHIYHRGGTHYDALE
jgi:hypothetical protein